MAGHTTKESARWFSEFMQNLSNVLCVVFIGGCVVATIEAIQNPQSVYERSDQLVIFFVVTGAVYIVSVLAKQD